MTTMNTGAADFVTSADNALRYPATREETDMTTTHAEIGTWIEMDDRTNLKFETEDSVRISVKADDDVTPEDSDLIAQSLSQRYGGTWSMRSDEGWSAADGEDDVSSLWTRRPAADSRYEVRPIADADCTLTGDVVSTHATAEEAAAAAAHAGGVYGAAVVDTETGLTDWGQGFVPADGAAAVSVEASRLARRLYRDDLSRANEVPVERDGAKAYDTWVTGARAAGDQDTIDALAAVDRDEFAAAWEALATV